MSRLQYLLIKFLSMIAVMLLITFVSFLIFNVFQDSTITHACGKPCTLERYERAKVFMQMDKNIIMQFIDFLRGIFEGRTYGGVANANVSIRCSAPCFGYSLQLNKPVSTLLMSRFEVTFSIAIVSSIIWVVIGVGLGIISALKRNKWQDKAINVFQVILISAPTYLVGIIALAIFGFNFHIFPTSGYVSFLRSPAQWLWHLLLPCLILGLFHSVIYIKMTRSGLIDAFFSDYYKTFSTYGLSKRTLFFKYGLRTTFLPMITVFGLNFGGILAGAVITESVFSLPGLGMLLISAAHTHDIPVILGCILLSSVFILVSNFIVDSIYVLLDPRMSTNGEKK